MYPGEYACFIRGDETWWGHAWSKCGLEYLLRDKFYYWRGFHGIFARKRPWMLEFWRFMLGNSSPSMTSFSFSRLFIAKFHQHFCCAHLHENRDDATLWIDFQFSAVGDGSRDV